MGEERRRVGIRDVAAAAGLSITTVSFALNDSGQVSAGTRERVRRLAQELGYQPNAAARSLKSGRSRILGVAVGHRSSRPWAETYAPYYRSVIAGAAIAAVEHGHAVAAVPVDPRGRFELPVPVDGLILVDPGRRDPVLQGCADRGIPVVADGRPLDERFAAVPVVAHDVHGGVAQVVEHLAASGVRRPALLTGPRADAYTVDTELAFRALTRARGMVPVVRQVGVREAAQGAAAALLTGPDAPDAVHCLNETYGHALLAAVATAGLAVPDDLVVTMMGESASAGGANGVSYLVLDPAEVGGLCVRMLVDLLEGRPVQDVTVPCRFVPTTRPSARGPRGVTK